MDDDLDVEGKFQNKIIFYNKNNKILDFYIIFCYKQCSDITTHFTEETNLPDGTYPIKLSPLTQERFDCVIDWDLSPLEPHKVILMEKVVGDLHELGEGSDFWPLKHQIAVSIYVSSFFSISLRIKFQLYMKIMNN